MYEFSKSIFQVKKEKKKHKNTLFEIPFKPKLLKILCNIISAIKTFASSQHNHFHCRHQHHHCKNYLHCHQHHHCPHQNCCCHFYFAFVCLILAALTYKHTFNWLAKISDNKQIQQNIKLFVGTDRLTNENAHTLKGNHNKAAKQAFVGTKSG